MKRRALLAAFALLLAAPASAQLFSPNSPTLAERDGLFSPAPPTFNFMTGTLPPGVTLTRASVGWHFDATGTLVSKAADLPRFEYDGNGIRGLWNEPAATDVVRNSSGIGAVPGTPGTPPTNWTIPAPGGGLNCNIVGTGTEAGIPYIDLQYVGNRATNIAHLIDVETAPGPATVAGDIWGALAFAKIQSLTSGTVQTFRLSATPLNAGGGSLTNIILGGFTPPIGGTLLAGQVPGAGTMSDALTASMRPRYQITVLSGPTDLVVRVGLPSFFRSAFGSSGGRRNSPIITTTAAVTRAVEVLTLPLANGTYAVAVDTSTGPTMNLPSEVVTGGAYVVPNTDYPIVRITAIRTGP